MKIGRQIPPTPFTKGELKPTLFEAGWGNLISFFNASSAGILTLTLSFFLFNIAFVNPAFADTQGYADCRKEAIASGCDKTDETCIQDYCASKALNDMMGVFDKRDNKDDNLEDTNEANNDHHNDEFPKCLSTDNGETFYQYCDQSLFFFIPLFSEFAFSVAK